MVKYESKPQFDINSNRYPQVLFSESDFSYIQRLQKTINSLVAKPPHHYHRDTILILVNINIQKMSYGIIQTYVSIEIKFSWQSLDSVIVCQKSFTT